MRSFGVDAHLCTCTCTRETKCPTVDLTWMDVRVGQGRGGASVRCSGERARRGVCLSRLRL